MKKIFLASFALTIFAASITLVQMISCKKTLAQTKSRCEPSIIGLWIGAYTVDGQPGLGQQYFSIIVKPDGTTISDTKGENQQHLGIGPWTMNGDTLVCISTCVYGLPGNIGVVERFTAIYNNVTGTLSHGIWKNYPNPIGTGTFNLIKVD